MISPELQPSLGAHDLTVHDYAGAAEEQLMVEAYYSSVSSGNSYYYIGLERPGPVGSNWYLSDGTPVGNGIPSNSNPYAHWWASR